MLFFIRPLTVSLIIGGLLTGLALPSQSLGARHTPKKSALKSGKLHSLGRPNPITLRLYTVCIEDGGVEPGNPAYTPTPGYEFSTSCQSSPASSSKKEDSSNGKKVSKGSVTQMEQRAWNYIVIETKKDGSNEEDWEVRLRFKVKGYIDQPGRLPEPVEVEGLFPLNEYSVTLTKEKEPAHLIRIPVYCYPSLYRCEITATAQAYKNGSPQGDRIITTWSLPRN